MSRNKGKRGEREIVDMLQPVVNEIYLAHGKLPVYLKRNSLQTDCGGEDIAGLDWLALEVKYQETTNLTAWWAQTLKQAGSSKEPVLIYRKNRMPWMAKLKLRTIVEGGILGGTVDCCGHALVAIESIIGIDDFLRWFRFRLNAVLQQQQD